MEFDILPGCLVSVGINICKMYRWTFRTFFCLKRTVHPKKKNSSYANVRSGEVSLQNISKLHSKTVFQNSL